MALSAPLSVGKGDRRKASSPFKGGVSSHQGEAFFTSTRRPLHLQTTVFTPLSITSLRSVTAGSERGRGCSWLGVRHFSTWKKWLNDSLLWHFEHGIHRWHEGAKRHRAPKGTWESTEADALFVFKHWSSLPSPFGEGLGVRPFFILNQLR